MRFANRARGSGTRVVLDELLAAQKIPLEALHETAQPEPSHRAAAEAVASGSADAAFGIEAAARARGWSSCRWRASSISSSRCSMRSTSRR